MRIPPGVSEADLVAFPSPWPRPSTPTNNPPTAPPSKSAASSVRVEDILTCATPCRSAALRNRGALLTFPILGRAATELPLCHPTHPWQYVASHNRRTTNSKYPHPTSARNQYPSTSSPASARSLPRPSPQYPRAFPHSSAASASPDSASQSYSSTHSSPAWPPQAAPVSPSPKSIRPTPSDAPHPSVPTETHRASAASARDFPQHRIEFAINFPHHSIPCRLRNPFRQQLPHLCLDLLHHAFHRRRVRTLNKLRAAPANSPRALSFCAAAFSAGPALEFSPRAL